MNILCPVCKKILSKQDKTYKCENRHSFDIAKEGYINLYLHKSQNSGDNPDMIKNRNPGCLVITWKEALAGGEHQTFELGYVSVEAVEAGYNRNHNVKECVGYILTLPGGVSVYVSGDTSKTEQMPLLAQRKLDYAFFCCDGIYNMDLEEAAECAELVGAKHNIPYHMAPGKLFDRARAEKFNAPNRLILAPGEEIELV